jgi:hypothetical protein
LAGLIESSIIYAFLVIYSGGIITPPETTNFTASSTVMPLSTTSPDRDNYKNPGQKSPLEMFDQKIHK